MAKISFNIALLSYLGASLQYFFYLVYRRRGLQLLAGITVAVGLLAHTAIIAIRARETGHGPYTTSFEVALFCAWLIVVAYGIAEWKYRIKDLGSFVIPLVFLILLYAAFLSKDAAMPIPESEARFWLTMHRTLSILGYSAFAISFAVGLMYLIQEHQVKSKKLGIMYFRMPSLEVLDNLNFQIIAIGFPLFTLGFLTGAVWNVKMDIPIFSWKLVKTLPMIAVWLIYGFVFFGRMTTGLRGKKAAKASMVGFVAVVITYFMHT